MGAYLLTEHSKCKELEVGTFLMCLQNCKAARVAKSEKVRAAVGNMKAKRTEDCVGVAPATSVFLLIFNPCSLL